MGRSSSRDGRLGGPRCSRRALPDEALNGRGLGDFCLFLALLYASADPGRNRGFHAGGAGNAVIVFGAIGVALLGVAQPQLRGPVMLTQQEALEFRREALALDLEARVERSYQHDSGWEYRVWIGGLESRGAADLSAERLAGRTGHGVTVVDEGEEGHAVLPEPLQELPSSEEVQKRMLRAPSTSRLS